MAEDHKNEFISFIETNTGKKIYLNGNPILDNLINETSFDCHQLLEHNLSQLNSDDKKHRFYEYMFYQLNANFEKLVFHHMPSGYKAYYATEDVPIPLEKTKAESIKKILDEIRDKCGLIYFSISNYIQYLEYCNNSEVLSEQL
jgi:hypothetical protein